MSSLWDVPTYLIMAFSLALNAPVEKASRVPLTSPTVAIAATSPPMSNGGVRTSVMSEQTWLAAVKTAAPSSDILQGYGARIFVTSSGRYYVPSAHERNEILALRSNGEIATRVLAAATREHKAALETSTGQSPTRGALLVAHLYGRGLAERYVRSLARTPEARAATLLSSVMPASRDDASLTLGVLDRRLSQVLGEGRHEIAAARTRVHDAPLKGTLTKPEAQPASAAAGALASAR